MGWEWKGMKERGKCEKKWDEVGGNGRVWKGVGRNGKE